jgi:hypothetical protein
MLYRFNNGPWEFLTSWSKTRLSFCGFLFWDSVSYTSCIYWRAQVLLKSVANDGWRSGAALLECHYLFITWSSLIQGLMARLVGRRAPGTAGRCRQSTDTQLRPGALLCTSRYFSKVLRNICVDIQIGFVTKIQKLQISAMKIYSYCTISHWKTFLEYEILNKIYFITNTSVIKARVLTAQTLGSWVRISLDARRFVPLSSIVLFCIGRSLATGRSPVQGVLPNIDKRFEKLAKKSR